jgi:hypothetical protein
MSASLNDTQKTRFWVEFNIAREKGVTSYPSMRFCCPPVVAINEDDMLSFFVKSLDILCLTRPIV